MLSVRPPVNSGLSFFGKSSYTWIFNSTGLGTPSPHIVQGSTVKSLKNVYTLLLTAWNLAFKK